MNIKSVILFLSILLYSNVSFCQDGYMIFRDSEVEAVIKKIAFPIFIAAKINPETVRVFIVNDKMVNAYVDGNNNDVFLNYGLFEFSNDPSVLIGVLAHEVGHISQKHVLFRRSKVQNSMILSGIGYVLGIITAITVNPDMGQAIALATNDISKKMFFLYSRLQEASADQCALRYLDEAGYSNDGLIKMFKHFYSLEAQYRGNIDQYLLSHPLSYDRLLQIQNYRNRNEVHGFSDEDVQKFKRVVEKINAFFNPVERLVNDKNDINQLSPYIQSIIFYKQSDVSKALEKLDNLILQSPEDPYLYELKAQILYKAGDIKKSVENYKLALKFSFDDVLIKLETSQALLLYDQKEAVNYLEQVTYQEPDNVFAWKQLAVAYGKIGDLGMSYFSLANKSFFENNRRDFDKYFSLARKYLPKDSVHLERMRDLRINLLSNT
ncbi:peptidase M48 family protein [Ehrlichia chaffeensis str. Heartland]|uniref:Peptidase, M48 family n=2 Tax=Ehrlichia chaffeensis TaxID=945 RepID=Q2GHB6_EHRCR|nr:M48 family metalloprotease [Ehrlichia chaffeensis]ABD45178.1 peptidase, M48 family [Ehrlichia chaffeensis str. Arkansas]AHX06811.1 peptidase M48 family protein [Ehrlichia chaffeensis str. Liberty]AHX09184.1 peptidase M48 family protein [Ehrlichia chaffeensis str. Wakulla]AHX10818.1 peptidase M48 family protein [Ehrlichia chaffeensis str. West Paces]AHX03461.1 peptidase M48 family protein [Ehrlichia chaffeensis str. Heartland]